MSRPTVVYPLMLVVLVAGLWGVLACGAHLSAPEDLAGRWQLQSTIRGKDSDTLMIEQSGRFFQVAFASGAHLDLQLAGRTKTGLKLSNAGSTLTIWGVEGSDDKTMELSGNIDRWNAHRVQRAFPVDVTAAEAH